MSSPIPHYFLVQRETGERFAIRRRLSIGRTTASLKFSDDAKLSQTHCQLTPSPEGLWVEDLESANGTFVDGIRLQPRSKQNLGAGKILRVGDQSFSLQIVLRPKGSMHKSATVLLALGLCALIFYFGLLRTDPPKNGSPSTELSVAVLNRELVEIFNSYQNIQNSLSHRTASPQQLVERLQVQVLSRLGALNSRLNPSVDPTSPEPPGLTALHEFATALNEHASAELKWIQTGDPHAQETMDHWREVLSKIAQAAQTPGQDLALPLLLDSPAQLVERAIRGVLHEYKIIGAAAESHSLSNQETSEKIRRDLVPKFAAVASDLQALKPESPAEAQRIAIEKQLIAAYLKQVQAMDLYNISADLKYRAQLDHWSEEIEKWRAELNRYAEADRLPASPAPGPSASPEARPTGP